MKCLAFVALTAALSLLAVDAHTQNIVLVNGQATEVILDGDDIKSIVRNKIVNYMHDYGQTVDDEFRKANLQFEEALVSNKIDKTPVEAAEIKRPNHFAVVLPAAPRVNERN